MRTIAELLNLDGRVYVHLSNKYFCKMPSQRAFDLATARSPQRENEMIFMP